VALWTLVGGELGQGHHSHTGQEVQTDGVDHDMFVLHCNPDRDDVVPLVHCDPARLRFA
jgi:hypothetical protein